MKHKQLVYIDESGDTGFKVTSGSTATLIIAAVIFDSPEAAESTAKAICDYRQSIGKGRRFPFHFTNLKHEWRMGFLEAVRPCTFRIRAVAMRKDRIYADSKMRQRGDYFYNYTCKLLLSDGVASLTEAKVFIDGQAGRETLRRLVVYLRRECNQASGHRVFTEVKQVPKSEGNVLVQLADMCVGAIARSYREDRPDPASYRRVIGPRIENVWEFGRKPAEK